LIIFTHIQKTSGCSIREIIKNQNNTIYWYRRCGDDQSPDIDQDVISGHTPYGIH